MMTEDVRQAVEAVAGQSLEAWFADGRQNLRAALEAVPEFRRAAVAAVTDNPAYAAAVAALVRAEQEETAVALGLELLKTLMPLIVTAGLRL
jgi:hypothetical protein